MAAAVRRVVADAAPASNVEALGFVVDVGELGEVGVFRADPPAGRHLLAVLGVIGEQGAEYAAVPDVSAALAHGEYHADAGAVAIRPARGPTGWKARSPTAKAIR